MAYWKLRAMGEEEETQDGRRHEAVYEVQVTKVLCRDACVVWYHSAGIEVSILLHGKYHGKEECKTRGPSVSTKRWVLGSNELKQ